MTNSFLNFDTSKMSDSELEFYTYVENHLYLISRISLHELSSKLYLSKTFIIRFCKKNKLSGFTDLKYLIKNELSLKKKRQSNFRKQIEQQIEELKLFFEFIPQDEVKQLVKVLCSKQPIYIHGRSLSSISAKYLHTILNTLNRPCILIEDLHLLNSISRTIKKDSLIFICSVNMPSNVYQEVLENAKRNQAKTILLTANNDDSIKSLSDYYLYCDDKIQTFNQTDVNSRIHMLSAIQIIIELLTQELLIN